ncbi:hypothetical protein Tco_0626048 [Tanacetum coccineum]|uniref:Uncharacterized protein n=1 Tax=Tanacetum coccineum TaxID=301880 RepID=A0ABQ4WIH8_9ASTR
MDQQLIEFKCKARLKGGFISTLKLRCSSLFITAALDISRVPLLKAFVSEKTLEISVHGHGFILFRDMAVKYAPLVLLRFVFDRVFASAQRNSSKLVRVATVIAGEEYLGSNGLDREDNRGYCFIAEFAVSERVALDHYRDAFSVIYLTYAHHAHLEGYQILDPQELLNLSTRDCPWMLEDTHYGKVALQPHHQYNSWLRGALVSTPPDFVQSLLYPGDPEEDETEDPKEGDMMADVVGEEVAPLAPVDSTAVALQLIDQAHVMHKETCHLRLTMSAANSTTTSAYRVTAWISIPASQFLHSLV